jgi:hypothetical protein
MTSILSSLNNTNKPLNSLITFGGKYELVNAYTSYSIGIKTDSACVITIYQSYDGVSDDDFDVFVSTTNIFANHQANLYLPYARISIFNATGTNQTYMLCTTKWMSVIPLPLQLSNVSLAPNSNVIVSSGTVSLSTGSNTIGSITVANSLSQLRNTPFVVGNWYQVASIGDTIGAVWAEAGAIWDGEALPPIGRQFQCLYPCYGTGTCYDITAPTNIKINPTASQAVRITGLGNTALLISSLGLCYGTSLINKSVTTNCWVKFYVKSTAPTELDTPFLIQYLEYVAQYNLNSHNDDWFNMPIGFKLWVRATLTSADGDTTDTGINAEATIFIGS